MGMKLFESISWNTNNLMNQVFELTDGMYQACREASPDQNKDVGRSASFNETFFGRGLAAADGYVN
jgi:hypothetical protein